MVTHAENVSRSRRLALKAALAAAPLSASGCGWLLRARDLQPVCPNAPAVSHLAGRLTIDAHCHVFNGTDLQVEEFLARIAVRQGGALGFAARAIGDVLEKLAWQYAPTGDVELRGLAELASALQTCTPDGYSGRVAALKEDGYQRGRDQLRLAAQRSDAMSSLRNKRSLGPLSVAPNSVDAARLEALSIIEQLPATAAGFKAQRADARLRGFETFSGQPKSLATFSVQGLINFVLQNFQYRYVSVHDYLETYNRPGERVVDLMLPSMVDYDFWLKKGDPTRTPLSTQVKVMRQLAILTGGRVHGFVPFDPLRQVAHELDPVQGDSLTLVRKAVMEDGCVGVKLYPPMGFAALGNAEKDGQGFWKQNWLPSWADRNDLGSRLDRAMRALFTWCQAEQVPVMAHTSASNGPSDAFEQLTDARYWELALAEFPRLRVNFGHFGGSTPVAAGLARAQAFSELMHDDAGRAGTMAFADAGYFVEVMSREPDLQTVVRRLYEDTSGKGGAALVNRFIYGTDWEMTLTEGPVDSYLGGFEALFADMESQPLMKAQGHTDLAKRFFGWNAARWVGLFAGEATRARLDRFYEGNSVAKPDWAVKLDREDR